LNETIPHICTTVYTVFTIERTGRMYGKSCPSVCVLH